MMQKIVVSGFDLTGNMVKPWAEAGYLCYCVDMQHAKREERVGNIVFVRANMHDWLPPRGDIAAAFFFPPCTDVAVSGAKHFRDKGLGALIRSLECFKRSVDLAEMMGAPYMIENPVSTVSSYWRKPDYIFHPHQFTELCPEDNYTKSTCLWTGNGFAMPAPCKDFSLGSPDDRIHKAAPGPERANFRSATPMGFARAVFAAHHQVVMAA
jgi:hypothetical protein